MDDSLDAEEQRVRAILRLPKSAPSASSAARPGRHRFLRDGEVPVTVVNARHGRPAPDKDVVAELERTLAAERQERSAVERALEQARETIRQLQTRLAHAEIAQREAAPSPIEPAPQPPPAELPMPPQQGGVDPAEDDAVDWWKPGWRERFRARSKKAG